MQHQSVHNTDSYDCWCRPTYLVVCECDDGCWKCNGGTIEVSREVADATDEPVIVVHNDDINSEA